MEECCTVADKDALSPSIQSCSGANVKVEPVVVDCLAVDDAARKRHRRKLRMEYIRSKRSKLAGGVATKRPRLDPVFTSFTFNIGVVVEEAPSLDAAKLRQLKNRESAERSRLKKDNLIDCLTCQVCESYVQLSDLLAENQWLLDAQDALASGRPVPAKCGYDSDSSYYNSSTASDCSSVTSGSCSPVTEPCCSSSSSSFDGSVDGMDADCSVSDDCCSALSAAASSSGIEYQFLETSADSSPSAASSNCFWEVSDSDFDSVIDDFDLLLAQAAAGLDFPLFAHSPSSTAMCF